MIPNALQRIDRWMLGKKEQKCPCDSGGKPAKWQDPANWLSYEVAKGIREGDVLDLFCGIGLVTKLEDGNVVIDVDGVFGPDGKVVKGAIGDDGYIIDEELERLIVACGSYCEVSQSGKGIHLFVKATSEKSGKIAGTPYEVYHSERFVVITGTPVKFRNGYQAPDTLAANQGAFDALFAYMMSKATQKATKRIKVATKDGDVAAETEVAAYADISDLDPAEFDDEYMRRLRHYYEKMPISESGNGGHARFIANLATLYWKCGATGNELRQLAKEVENSLTNEPWSDKEIAHKIDSVLANGGCSCKVEVRRNFFRPGAATCSGELHEPPVLNEVAKNKQKLMEDLLPCQRWYEAAPAELRDLIATMYSINDIAHPASYYWLSYVLYGSLLGRKIAIDNKGRRYYPNLNLVCLQPTGSNKSGVVKTLRDGIQTATNATSVHEIPIWLLQDKISLSALYHEMGTVISKKEMEKLDPNALYEKKRQCTEKAKSLKPRLMLSDEFAYAFGDMLSSGPNGRGVTGGLLDLLDGENVNGTTNTDGYRCIENQVLSVIAFSQPEIWHKTFGAAENVDSGLFGRLIVVDSSCYAVPTIPRVADRDYHTRILALHRKLVALQPCVVTCDMDTSAGDIYDQEVASPLFRMFAEHVPFDKLKGKILVWALKLMVIDSIAKRNVTELGTIQGQDLIDWQIYKSFVFRLLANCCKLFTANPTNSEFAIAEKKVVLMLQKEGKVSASDISRMNLKVGYNWYCRKPEAEGIIERLAERGVCLVLKGNKGGMVAKWTGKIEVDA